MGTVMTFLFWLREKKVPRASASFPSSEKSTGHLVGQCLRSGLEFLLKLLNLFGSLVPSWRLRLVSYFFGDYWMVLSPANLAMTHGWRSTIRSQTQYSLPFAFICIQGGSIILFSCINGNQKTKSGSEKCTAKMELRSPMSGSICWW